MNIRSRIDRLEKQIPKPEVPKWPDFDIPTEGGSRSAMQLELVRRLKLYAEDSRATKEQREQWLAAIPKIESALRPPKERPHEHEKPTGNT